MRAWLRRYPAAGVVLVVFIAPVGLVGLLALVLALWGA